MTINLAGLAVGNAWTDPFSDNTATVSHGWNVLGPLHALGLEGTGGGCGSLAC
jgi:hypothetical protein